MSTEIHYRQQALPSGTTIFYREAGQYGGTKPTILLLHGFPTSSHMFRTLIPLLAPHYHCMAPDLPGFGHTTTPAHYRHTFDQLASTLGEWVEALRLERYVLYVFDYGAPVGLRLAMARPERVLAIVSQNGNAYEEGLSDGWAPIRKLWTDNSADNRKAIEFLFQQPGLDFQYKTGVADPTRLSPDSPALDLHFLAHPTQPAIQLDLLYDYRTNVALYPRFQAYLRESQVPLLAVWGAGDPFFLPAGAAAFKRDSPSAVVRMVEGAGHFLLETHVDEVAAEIVAFLGKLKLQ